jgi:hypothetical protein
MATILWITLKALPAAARATEVNAQPTIVAHGSGGALSFMSNVYINNNESIPMIHYFA